MRTIWKYPLKLGANTLEMPNAAQALSVQAQDGVLYLWMLVRTEARTERRCFMVFGTGGEIPEKPLSHIGTVLCHGGVLVCHVFELERFNDGGA